MSSVTNDDEMIFYRPIQANPSNQLALAEFRRGLQFDCVVPLVSWVTDGVDAYHAAMNHWSDVRDLHFLLEAEETVVREQGRTDYAAQCALELIELALEAFRRRHDDHPGGLAELAPGILKRLPEDPFGNTGFVYRRNSTSYSLYSLGADGEDADFRKRCAQAEARRRCADMAIGRHRALARP